MNKNTLFYIAEAIRDHYNIEINKALDIVKNSFIIEHAKKHPDDFMHYDAEYWAMEIMDSMSVR